jgi:hypothetical protein
MSDTPLWTYESLMSETAKRLNALAAMWDSDDIETSQCIAAEATAFATAALALMAGRRQ